MKTETYRDEPPRRCGSLRSNIALTLARFGAHVLDALDLRDHGGLIGRIRAGHLRERLLQLVQFFARITQRRHALLPDLLDRGGLLIGHAQFGAEFRIHPPFRARRMIVLAARLVAAALLAAPLRLLRALAKLGRSRRRRRQRQHGC
jgi:hypothetical protein